MRRIVRVSLLGWFAAFGIVGVSGCGHQSHGIHVPDVPRDSNRFWVVTTDTKRNQEIYRCVDAGEGKEAPNPICKQAALTPDPQPLD